MASLLLPMMAAAQPGLDFVKTVGTDPSVCATTSQIMFPPGGGTAVYCYEATNTGNVTFTVHDLVDDQLGALLTSFPYTLAPGASAFLTQSAVITATTTNVATWIATAANLTPAVVVTATDSALVTVQPLAPALVLVKTVGTDPSVCATTNQVTFPPGGGTAVYCYEVTNTGNVTFTVHDLVDDQLGALLTSFPYTLAPGASAFLTQAAVITTTTTNDATWTASGPGVGPAAAGDQAAVVVQGQFDIPTLSTGPLLLLVLLISGAGLLFVRRMA
jgi:hypothetical protein